MSAEVIDPTVPLRLQGLNPTGIVPKDDWVMMRLRQKKKTAAGVILPENSWSSPHACPWQVIAIGPKVKHVQLGFGAITEAGRESLTSKRVNGEDWKIGFVREKHIIAHSEGDVSADDPADVGDMSGKMTSGHGNGNRYIGR